MTSEPSRPSRRVVPHRVVRAAQSFISLEVSGGVVLLVASLTALAWANSPWYDHYFELLHTHLVLDLGVIHIDESLQHWVNDGLMTIFFFLMGNSVWLVRRR